MCLAFQPELCLRGGRGLAGNSPNQKERTGDKQEEKNKRPNPDLRGLCYLGAITDPDFMLRFRRDFAGVSL